MHQLCASCMSRGCHGISRMAYVISSSGCHATWAREPRHEHTLNNVPGVAPLTTRTCQEAVDEGVRHHFRVVSYAKPPSRSKSRVSSLLRWDTLHGASAADADSQPGQDAPLESSSRDVAAHIGAERVKCIVRGHTRLTSVSSRCITSLR
jgi:hypothetical protein